MIILGPMKMLGLGKSLLLEKPPSLMTSSRWLPSRASGFILEIKWELHIENEIANSS